MSGRRNDADGTEAADPAGLRRALAVPMTDETLERALTHRSYAYENGGLPTNERLEFLGDRVLALVMAETLVTRDEAADIIVPHHGPEAGAAVAPTAAII